jgi:hypothetical protein
MVSRPTPGKSTFLLLVSKLLLPAVCLLILVCNASTALASELSFLVNGKSVHTGPKKNNQYNEKNWGFGFQYEFAHLSDRWVPYVTVSGFVDSQNENSYYAGGGYMRRFMLAQRANYLHLDAGLIGFLMTRQDYKDGEPFPGVLPALSLGTRHVALNVTYIPEVDSRMAELWFFQLKLSMRNLKSSAKQRRF